jgi:hypothetical protein
MAAESRARHDLVVLFDVDNTLLDNDRVKQELQSAVADCVGPQRGARFWEIYEDVRAKLDYVSLPETLERFVRESGDERGTGRLSDILYHVPFAHSVYPGALAALEHAKAIGALPVVLSDGDQLFQRHKIRSAGLEEAVDGRVLVTIHKELSTVEMRERYPAAHYAIVDDKPRIHPAMKQAMGDAITTVLVRQGKYALASEQADPAAIDIVLESIDDFAALTREQLLRAARGK